MHRTRRRIDADHRSGGTLFLDRIWLGLVLGPVRVYWLEPQLGETMATLCEAPFLLIAIVLTARWLPKLLSLKTNVTSLAAMGIGALFLQQLADFAVGRFLRGITPAQQISHLARPAGLIYATLVIIFAVMPILANWSHRRRNA
jgi:hypothetical protein